MQTSSARTVGLGVRLPIASGDEFIEKFGASLTRGGIYLRAKKVVPPGTRVTLDLKLADGAPLLQSSGLVEFVTGQQGKGTPGMGIRFLELSPAAKQFLEEALERLPAANTDGPPIPPGVGPVEYGKADDADVVPIVAAGPLLTSSPTPHATLPFGMPAAVENRRETAPPSSQDDAPAPAAAASAPAQKSASESARARFSVRSAERSDPAPELSAFARELKSLRRQVRMGWVAAGLVAVAAFLGGRLSFHAPANTTQIQQPAPVAPVVPEKRLTAEEERALDFEPAVEDEPLTPEEQAQADEVIAGEAPVVVDPPKAIAKAVPKKLVAPKNVKSSRKAPVSPLNRGTLVANAGHTLDSPTTENTHRQLPPVNDAESKFVADALAAGRGSSCKGRMDALTELVARTRVPSHREAGIVLRARCFADTWRVEDAKSEFRRYLREFPTGRFADEARRVLAN